MPKPEKSYTFEEEKLEKLDTKIPETMSLYRLRIEGSLLFLEGSIEMFGTTREFLWVFRRIKG